MAKIDPVEVTDITEEMPTELSSNLYIFRQQENGKYCAYSATIEDLSSVLATDEDLSALDEKVEEVKGVLKEVENYLKETFTTLSEAKQVYDMDSSIYNKIKKTWITLAQLNEKIGDDYATTGYLNQKKNQVLKEHALWKTNLMTFGKDHLNDTDIVFENSIKGAILKAAQTAGAAPAEEEGGEEKE